MGGTSGLVNATGGARGGSQGVDAVFMSFELNAAKPRLPGRGVTRA
jgi:hypothetical protein